MEMVEALEEVRQSRLLINRLDAWLYEEIKPYLGRRVMEIGCGLGNFTAHLLDRDLVIASDFEPTSVTAVRKQFASHRHVLPRVYDICSPVDDQLRQLNVDSIFSINVLEHIQDDQLAMNNMADILCDEGRVVLIVPAHQWAYGTMDSSIGHFRRYTKKSVRTKLQRAGFVIDKQYYLNVLGLLGWFVGSRIYKHTVPPRGQLSVFNKLVPLIKSVERCVRPPVGLSVVSIASRPAANERRAS